MSSKEEVVVEAAKEAVKETVNATIEAMASLEELTGVKDADLFLAYFAMLIMAIVPIYIGSHWSLHEAPEGEEKEPAMTTKDAAMFPVYASGFLFGLYCIFNIFGKEYINYLLTGYFMLIGTHGVGHVLAPLVAVILRAVGMSSLLEPFDLSLTRKSNSKDAKDGKEVFFDCKFDYSDIIGLAIGAVVGGAYFKTNKHWLTNNIFGLSFSIYGVEQLSLGSYKIAAVLLGGLFFYDVFWVFGTDVMVTVAKSFDAPIKLLFPKDILAFGPIHAKQFTMLGLGDIVIPGVFVALLLRFDRSLAQKGAKSFSRVYFWTGYIAYIIGLVTTVVVMHVFEAAQPALLYLVPSCLGISFFVALCRGEVDKLLAYHDEEDNEKKETKKNK